MCVCVCVCLSVCLSGVFISVPLRPPTSSSLEVSSPPPTSLLPGGLGKGLSGRSRQSRKRRRGSEAIGRAAPGEGARGPHGKEGPLGAELPWLLPASPLPRHPTPLHSRRVRGCHRVGTGWLCRQEGQWKERPLGAGAVQATPRQPPPLAPGGCGGRWP